LREVQPIPISTRETLALDTMRVRSVRTPHDAMEPVALIVESIRSGARCGIAYDMGHVSQSVERALADVDILVLESNHDEAMLRDGDYPLALKRRISGGRGHLSNAHAAGLLQRLVHSGLSHVVLAHLSADNNRPRLALETVAAAARRARFRGTLVAATQDGVTRVHAARGPRHEQMLLDL
jgi:phosphoribosyl 1,2-cyclic phosphodiesterase